MAKEFTTRLFFVLATGLALGTPLLAEKVRLYAPAPGRYDELGTAVAAQGGVVVVGAPLADEPEDSGSIWVYDSTAGAGWPAFGPFKAPSPEADQRFGQVLAYADGEIFVGGGGQVYRLERDPLEPGNWIHQAPILPPVASTGFGLSLALDGDELAIGDQGAIPGSGSLCGQVLVFRNEGGWSHQQTVPNPTGCTANPGQSELFGVAVGKSGDNLAVGTWAGKVYLFRRTAGGFWQHEQTLDPAPQSEDDFAYFGGQLALEGDRLLVSSRQPIAGSGLPGNRAYIYERLGAGNWALAATLMPQAAPPLLQFGFGLALRGGIAAVGSPDEEFGGNPGIPGTGGAAYLFARQSDGSWPQVRRDASLNGLNFGEAIALDGAGHLVAGSRWETIGFTCCYGAAYVIDVAPAVFADGFESGGTGSWSAVLP